jgi:hypothetical protein
MMKNIELIRALAKAEALGWYIPAGWNALTREQQEAWAGDVLDNGGEGVRRQAVGGTWVLTGRLRTAP